MGELLRVGLPLAEAPHLVAWCSVTNMLAVSPLAAATRVESGGVPAGEQSGNHQSPSTAAVVLVDPSLPSDAYEVQVPLAGGAHAWRPTAWVW